MSFCSWGGSKEVYKDHFVPGVYCCSQCGYELFSSRQKFEHNSPWPAFTETIHDDSVSKHKEFGCFNAFKVKCGKCANPLGHEFLKDGPKGKSRF